MDIKEINFTEEDFELIIEALEFLPDKGTSGILQSKLIMLKRHMIENDLLKQANDSMKQ